MTSRALLSDLSALWDERIRGFYGTAFSVPWKTAAGLPRIPAGVRAYAEHHCRIDSNSWRFLLIGNLLVTLLSRNSGNLIRLCSLKPELLIL